MQSGDSKLADSGSQERRMDRFLDRQGRLAIWPSRRRDRLALLAYVRLKFEPQTVRTEREVNDLLRQWHTWNDPAQLRRMMIIEGFLERTPDGSKYWRSQTAGSPD